MLNPETAVRAAERSLEVSVGYSVLHHDRWVKTLHSLLDVCSPTTHPILLDVGVWPGYQSLALHELGFQVQGTDLDPSRLSNLPIAVSSLDLNHAERLPVADHSLDVIVATEMIEHLEPQRLPTFLLACQAALRPGGVMLITTPNRYQLGTLLVSRARGTDVAGHGHTHEFSLVELRHLFQTGWSDVRIEAIDVYAAIGKITDQEYYRPLWRWWAHPRRLHNAMKFVSSLIRAVTPPVRDTIRIIARP